MKTKKFDIKKYSLVIILVVMMLICTFLSSNFLTVKNITNILKQVSVVTILSFAQGMIIINGDIDLSIGYLASMAGSFACIIYLGTNSLVVAFICGMLIGAAVGLVNGLFVAHFKLPSFIVTLAMQTVCFGIICLYTGGQNIYQIGNFSVLGQSKVFGMIPITIVFMAIMLVITHILLKYSKFGRYLYAIGGNNDAAVAAGVEVRKVKWSIFVVSGVFAAVAGMIMMGRLNAGIPNQGAGYETDAITAAVIGGVSFSGGSGTAVGMLLGSLIIGVLNNIMNLLGIDSYMQMIVKGAIIILAVLLDSLSKSGKGNIKIMASKKEK